MSEHDADIIIVGGRPAGASLAARLGARGLRVIVLDRAEFPSLPAVPSCPILYPPAMKLLDELGVDEALYADDTAKMESFGIQFGEWFKARLTVPEMFGRSYVRGIDRASFDDVLWQNLDRYPTVVRRSGFAVSDVVRDAGGRVVGVTGAGEGSAVETLSAPLTVGADGRFSLVARKVSAKVVEDFSEKVSTVHFAEWEGLAPFDADNQCVGQVYTSGRGRSVLFFPIPRGRTQVISHMRADYADVRGDVEAFYQGALMSYPGVRRRLQGARRVSPILGMKRIANRYLEHAGPGWALVGDALHHKDPIDGQGIYDALVESKLLARAVLEAHDGKARLDDALADYGRAARAETHPMFLATLKRLERELYEEPPEIVIRTLLRWLVTDPEYQRRFVLFLGRAIPPDDWLPPSLIRDAALRGIARDLRRIARREASPHAVG